MLQIPRKHISTIGDATPEDEALLGKMILKANEIAAAEGLAEDGFRYVINCNQHGGSPHPPAFAHGFGGPDGLAYLRSLAFVDPDRIGAVGVLAGHVVYYTTMIGGDQLANDPARIVCDQCDVFEFQRPNEIGYELRHPGG